MKTRQIFLIGTFYLLSLYLQAGLESVHQIRYPQDPPTIEGEASQDFDADRLVVVFSFSEVLQATALDTSSSIAKRMQAVTEYLKAEGLPYQQSRLTLDQGRVYLGDKVATEHYGSQTVEVVFSDFSKMSRHFQAILDRGASGISKTKPELRDPYAAERQVRQLAIQDAYRRAQDLAEDLGFAEARFQSIARTFMSSVEPAEVTAGLSTTGPKEANMRIADIDDFEASESKGAKTIHTPDLGIPKVTIRAKISLDFNFLKGQR